MRTGRTGSNVHTQVLLDAPPLQKKSLNDNDYLQASADTGSDVRRLVSGQCLHSPNRQLCTGLAILQNLLS